MEHELKPTNIDKLPTFTAPAGGRLSDEMLRAYQFVLAIELQFDGCLISAPNLGERQEVIDKAVVVEAGLVVRMPVADDQLGGDFIIDFEIGGQRDAVCLILDDDLTFLAGVVVIPVGRDVGVAKTGSEDRAVGHFVDQSGIRIQAVVAIVAVRGNDQRKFIGWGPRKCQSREDILGLANLDAGVTKDALELGRELGAIADQ